MQNHQQVKSPTGFSSVTTAGSTDWEFNSAPWIVRKGNGFKLLLYLLLFVERTTLGTFPGLGYATPHAQPRLCSSRPPVRTKFYSILPRCSSYRTDVFKSHHVGTLMVTVVFNIHWDESPCMAVIKFPVPNILTLAAFSMWFQRKQTVMTFICRSRRHSPQEQREGCCLVVYDLAIWWWILRWGKAGQKTGKEQSNWRASPQPLFAHLFSPFGPHCRVHCAHTLSSGFPHHPVTLSCSTYV